MGEEQPGKWIEGLEKNRGSTPKRSEEKPRHSERTQNAEPIVRRVKTLSWTATTEKPPESRGWMTTLRTTRSRFLLQKNLKTSVLSSSKTRSGMGTREVTYQTLDKSRALMMRGLSPYESWWDRQELRQCSTASMHSRQLDSSRSPRRLLNSVFKCTVWPKEICNFWKIPDSTSLLRKSLITISCVVSWAAIINIWEHAWSVDCIIISLYNLY